ncbi:MAG TPA: TRAM domain-containing protein, partial [Thermomicrobiales bacterium]|nr:TRAM domain-containing protein [Thermomicrobiales bacterium]
MPPSRNARSPRPPHTPADRRNRPSRPGRDTTRDESNPRPPSRPARPGGERRTGSGHGNHPAPRRQLASDRAVPDMAPITVEIDRIVGDGKGIGFVDGRTVFVSRAVPGDFVRARVMRKQGKILHAEILEVLTPSPMRIEPRVPDFDASGGLDLQYIGYDHQLRVKAGIIEDSLRRIARLDPLPEVFVTPSPQEWEYRSRAEFQIDHRTGAVGYFASQSHRVVDVEESPVLTPEV